MGLLRIKYKPIRGYTPIFGVYFTSLICVLTSALIFNLFINKKIKTKIINSTGVVLIIFIGYLLYQINWTTHTKDEKQNKKTANIVLVQGNIHQEDKWNRKKLPMILTTYVSLSTKSLKKKNQLIFWPENAIPTAPQNINSFLKQIKSVASKNNNSILAGIPIYKNQKYYNGAIVLGEGKGTYLKQHLVPFGEYMPLQNYLSRAMNYFKIPMSDFKAGPSNQFLLK